MQNNIFINYRREDSTGYSLAIYNELNKWYQREMIFKDFNNIEPGEDFEESIDTALASCTILLVIIGASWMEVLKKRELKSSDPDFVRIEIATALSKGIYTIPIVISGVEMLNENELPDDIKRITKRQYLHLDPARFDTDILKLVKVIDKKLNIDRDGRLQQNTISKPVHPQTPTFTAAPANNQNDKITPSGTEYSGKCLKANYKTWLKCISLIAGIFLVALFISSSGKIAFPSPYKILDLTNMFFPLTVVILSFAKPIPAFKALVFLIIFYAFVCLLSYSFFGFFFMRDFTLMEMALCIVLTFIICYVKTKRFT